MNTPRAAAIYARISSDADGSRAGVDRQVEDCHALAAELGWPVAATYVDNDLSAFTGKRRPEYARMLTDLAEGVVDAVVVYNIDRLTRRPAELEHFHEVVQAANVTHVRFVTGDANMLTPDGLLHLRILGAFAAKESANIGRRVARKMDQIAAEGRPHGGARRPFGYADDKIALVPEEAEVLRVLIARFLAGESMRSLATWLNAQKVPTVTGREGWNTTTLRGIFTNPRYAGLRVHRGAVVGKGVWEPIISEEDHRRVLSLFAQRKTSGRRAPQRYLLSGLLRCGKCGIRLYSNPREGTRRYTCRSGPDHGGCGSLVVVAEPLEQFIADLVLHRLDTPALADALAGRASADVRTQELSAALEQIQGRLDDLPAAFAAGEITRRDWALARKPLAEKLEHLQRQLGQITRTSALTGLVGNGEQLGRAWESLTLSRQNAIVSTLVDHAVIGPGTPGVRTLDTSRVHVEWRF